MSEPDQNSTPQPQAQPQPSPSNFFSAENIEERMKQREQVFNLVFEQLKPWLIEFGSWIFGGLIAFNLILIGPLLTLGAVHVTILIAIALLACALPPNVLALFLLRLIHDINGVSIDAVMKQAFIDANVPNADAYFQDTSKSEAMAKRRTDVGLRYSSIMAGVSIALTLIGLIAALWYVGWWVATLFIITVVVILVIAYRILSQMLLPDEEERKRRQQYRDQLAQQKKDQRAAK